MDVGSAKKGDEQGEITNAEASTHAHSSSTRCVFCFCSRITKCTRMHQQDSCWSWIVCFSAFLSNVITLGCPYGFGVFLPSLLIHFKEGKGLTAWVGSLTMGLIFFLGPLAGKLIEKFGCRLVAIFGGLVNAVGLFLSSFVPSLPIMFLTFSVLCGLGTSCVYTASFVIVPKYFKRHRSLAVGILSSGLPCAILTMSRLGNFLLEVFDWREVLKIVSGFSLGVCFLALTFDSNVEETREGIEANNRRTRERFLQLFKSKRYVVFLVAAMVSYLVSYIPIIHLVKFAREVGVSGHEASWPLFCVGLASLLIRPVIGRLCDMSFLNPVYLYQTFLFFAGLAVILSGLASSFAGLMAYGFAYGMLLGGSQIAVYLLILTSLSSQDTTSGFSFFLCAISFSLAGGPSLAGFIADKTDSYKIAFYISGSFNIISCMIPFALRCCKKNEVQNETENFKFERALPVLHVSSC